MSSSNRVIEQGNLDEIQAYGKPAKVVLDPRKLIDRYCKKQDTDAFTGFYHQQADKLWRFLVARGCDEDTAYDILSESFLKFSQNICKDTRAPVAFLFRIAINLHIDLYRHNKRDPVKVDSDQVEAAPDSSTGHFNEHQYLRSLVKTLPDYEQNMLLMRFWIGLTHKEIAQALDMPEGTIRRQCSEIVQSLSDKWFK